MVLLRIIGIGAILLYTVFAIENILTGGKLDKNKPGRSFVMQTPLTKSEIFSAIYNLYLQSKYTIEDVDIEAGFILLSEDATLLHDGFFYPIYISDKNGETKVDVRIKSKGFSHSLPINRYHKQAFNTLKLAFVVSSQ